MAPDMDRQPDRIDLGPEPTADGCHAGADTMRDAARKAGQSEILDRYASDYPQGPHDQPQSMCPAFGSLRVGLRNLSGCGIRLYPKEDEIGPWHETLPALRHQHGRNR